MINKDIVTLTLNPALDYTYWLDEFKLEADNNAVNSRVDAAGKGVNVSCALKNMGVDSTAIIALGKESASQYIPLLQSTGTDHRIILCDGAVRKNNTFVIKGYANTRVCEHVPLINEDELGRIMDAVLKLEGFGIAVVSGSLPKGLEYDNFAWLFGVIKEKCEFIALDTSSLTLKQILELRPHFLKPNARELSDLFSDEPLSAREMVMRLHYQGIEHVLGTFGDGGALYAADGALYEAAVPCVTVKSAVGAGDSALAGFIAAMKRGKGPEERLQYAAASGTAACTTEGTSPPLSEDILKILADVRVVKL